MKTLTAIFITVAVCSLIACTNDTSSEKAEKENKGSQKTETVAPAVDYDITKLSPTMVYGQIFELMNNPASYHGKTFKMIGRFDSEYMRMLFEELNYIVIKDALGCCPMGIEIQFKEGASKPEKGQLIMIEGPFYQKKDGMLSRHYIQVDTLHIQADNEQK